MTSCHMLVSVGFWCVGTGRDVTLLLMLWYYNETQNRHYKVVPRTKQRIRVTTTHKFELVRILFLLTFLGLATSHSLFGDVG